LYVHFLSVFNISGQTKVGIIRDIWQALKMIFVRLNEDNMSINYHIYDLYLMIMKFSQIKSVLTTKTVGIAGAGGLGSNCAQALVRCGLGHLVLADFDVVEAGNLNRQFYFRDQIGMIKVDALRENLLKINPKVRIITHNVKIKPENIARFFDKVDVLVEAFDLADQKEMIIETALDHWPARPLVVGSGLAGLGKISSLEEKNYGELYICGDEIEETGPENPPLAPRVGIVANMQADVVIRILLKL
jgi:sulfur carrier protein ThiS adenylyltransferase